MDAIIELFNQNISSLFLGIFVLMFGFVAIVAIIEKVSVIINKPVKWLKGRNADHKLLLKTADDLSKLHSKHEEDIKQSIRHDEMMHQDLQKLSESILQIKEEVTLMRTQRDKDKLAEYKDKIGESYRYYSARKYSDEQPIPYWNHMEKEALEDLITQYEAHGGKNSFVHSKVEPEMQTWKVID